MEDLGIDPTDEDILMRFGRELKDFFQIHI